ncbi:hypothetical protein [Sneathiella glossodoripedis]|uniref:hypothetical protein n=1 Tax=Sneathiella glossodoripedis TaxID=418853 RepID=UPI00047284C1|nr:hypothetical protein [Sneathiella glossodoripedis]
MRQFLFLTFGALVAVPLMGCVGISSKKNAADYFAPQRFTDLRFVLKTSEFKSCLIENLSRPECVVSVTNKLEDLHQHNIEYVLTLPVVSYDDHKRGEFLTFFENLGIKPRQLQYNTVLNGAGKRLQITEYIPQLFLQTCMTKLRAYKVGCAVSQNRALSLVRQTELWKAAETTNTGGVNHTGETGQHWTTKENRVRNSEVVK